LEGVEMNHPYRVKRGNLVEAVSLLKEWNEEIRGMEESPYNVVKTTLEKVYGYDIFFQIYVDIIEDLNVDFEPDDAVAGIIASFPEFKEINFGFDPSPVVKLWNMGYVPMWFFRWVLIIGIGIRYEIYEV
jgi:hypothetical protein